VILRIGGADSEEEIPGVHDAVGETAEDHARTESADLDTLRTVDCVLAFGHGQTRAVGTQIGFRIAVLKADGPLAFL